MLNTIVKLTANESKGATTKKTNHVHSSNFKWNCVGGNIFAKSFNHFSFRSKYSSSVVADLRASAKKCKICGEKNYLEMNNFKLPSVLFPSTNESLRRKRRKKKREINGEVNSNMQFNRKIPFRACVDSAHRLNSSWDLKIKIITRDARSICAHSLRSNKTNQFEYILCANGVKINWYYLVSFNLCSRGFGAQRRVERKWKMKNEHYDTARITIQSQFIS